MKPVLPQQHFLVRVVSVDTAQVSGATGCPCIQHRLRGVSVLVYIYIVEVKRTVFLYSAQFNKNNKNGSLERLTRTGPKRVHIL